MSNRKEGTRNLPSSALTNNFSEFFPLPLHEEISPSTQSLTVKQKAQAIGHDYGLPILIRTLPRYLMHETTAQIPTSQKSLETKSYYIKIWKISSAKQKKERKK